MAIRAGLRRMREAPGRLASLALLLGRSFHANIL